MQKLQFGTYQFPYNPRRIQLSREPNLVEHILPGQGWAPQTLGEGPRKVHCQGELLGNTPQQTAELLEALWAGCQGEQTLTLPHGESFLAVVERLFWDAQGDGRVLSYEVAFSGKEGGGAG